MEWTERQKLAIEKSGSNLLVSAAAGSGKTAVLVERILRLILDEGADVDRMLIVTFTKAAASEMKQKIQRAINARICDAKCSPDERKKLTAQLNMMGRANISTFDSFALEIVHRYYHVTGLAPELSVCDEAKAALLRTEALKEMFEELFEASDPEFLYFLDCYSAETGTASAENIILSYHNYIQSLADPWKDSSFSEDETVNRFTEYAYSQCMDAISMAEKYFLKVKELLTAENLPKLAAKAALDISAVSDLKASFEKKSSDCPFSLLSVPLEFQRFTAAKDEKPAFELIKDQVKTFREKGKTCIKKAAEAFSSFSEDLIRQEYRESERACRILKDLTRRFDDKFREKKLAMGLADFSDIAHYALDILKDPVPSGEYRDKFDYIFIDEYQDSNMVQETLVKSIARENNLFMVGDVKQSIYKFRLAEPELFLSKYYAYKSGDAAKSEVIDLNNNFRSKQSVIDCVNELFSRIMTKHSCGIIYDEDSALVRGSGYSGPITYPPELYLIDTNSSDDPADPEIAELKSDELEALQIVEIIKKYYGQTIHDDKLGKDRPLDYKDMVILLRAPKVTGEVYYKTLMNADIPVFLERGEGYFDAIEIQIFLNLLRIIDNKKQDIPLLSVLKSPVFGFCSDELAEIRIHAGAVMFGKVAYNEAFVRYSSDGPDEKLREKCAAFLANISRWQQECRFMPLGDFIWKLLNETGYIDFASALPGGQQRRANLRTLADKAASYEKDSAGGLFGFISFVELLTGKDSKLDTGQTKIVTEGENCIRIMSIHKSKGLEFPMVIIGGMGKGFVKGSKTDIASFHKDFGMGIRLVNPKTGLYNDTNLLKLIKRRKSSDDEAESIRVLYVAMTRPKDILVFVGSHGGKNDAVLEAEALDPEDISSARNYLDLVIPNIPSLKIKRRPRESFAVIASENPEKSELEKALTDDFEKLVSSAVTVPVLSGEYFGADGMKRKYSVSQLAEAARKTDVDEEKKAPMHIAAANKSTLNAAQRGTAYHTVMEHIPFTPDNKSAEDIALFIDGLVKSNMLTQNEADCIEPEKIAAFFASDMAKRIYASSELCKEAPFVIKHVYQGREVLVQGTIDCCFKEGNEYVLLDYKSNYIDPEHREESYEKLKDSYLPQLALYKEALEEIKGIKVKESCLFLFGTGEFLDV